MEGNAETLDAVESNTFDAYTIAFGIRNCTHVDKVHYVWFLRFSCISVSNM